MGALTWEEVDLEALADRLQRRLGSHLEASYLRGKTVLRDAVVVELGCSDYEAEELVETLELMGYVHFPHLDDDTHPLGRLGWHLHRDGER